MQGLGLVFVAVYQKALKLLYVDDLLARAKAEFSGLYSPDAAGGFAARKRYAAAFDSTFRQMLKQAESQAMSAAPAKKRSVAVSAAAAGCYKVRCEAVVCVMVCSALEGGKIV